MSYKRLGVIAVLLMFLAFPASASMVSLLLVETGISEKTSSSQYSSLWEGGLMSVFFDAGHIITNNPIARMEKKPEPDLSGPVATDIEEAVRGGADFFILGFLEYKPQRDRVALSGITLKLYKADSRQIVFEQHFPAGTGKNSNEEYQFAQNAGRIIVSHIKER